MGLLARVVWVAMVGVLLVGILPEGGPPGLGMSFESASGTARADPTCMEVDPETGEVVVHPEYCAPP